MIKFYTMDHRGGLDESLATREEITEHEFRFFFMNYHYEYYCFDDRISCIRFIKRKINDNGDNPVWLLIEVKNEKF